MELLKQIARASTVSPCRSIRQPHPTPKFILALSGPQRLLMNVPLTRRHDAKKDCECDWPRWSQIQANCSTGLSRAVALTVTLNPTHALILQRTIEVHRYASRNGAAIRFCEAQRHRVTFVGGRNATPRQRLHGCSPIPLLRGVARTPCLWRLSLPSACTAILASPTAALKFSPAQLERSSSGARSFDSVVARRGNETEI